MYLVSLNVNHILGCCSDTRTKKYTRRVGMNFSSCLSLIIDGINCMIGSEVKNSRISSKFNSPNSSYFCVQHKCLEFIPRWK